MTRERIHSITGVVPLLLYLVLHVFEGTFAVTGREGFERGMQGVGPGTPFALELLFVILPLAIHIGLGVAIWMRPDPDAKPVHASGAFRTIQRATGVVVLLFLAFHLSHTFYLEALGADAGALYAVLRSKLGTPLYLGAYVVGTAAIALHLAIGLPAAARRFGLIRSDGGDRGVRIVSALFAAVLFFASVNTMSHFVVGDAFFGDSPATETP